MQNLVISIENPLDSQLLMSLVARLGLKARTLSAFEEQFLAIQSVTQISDNQQVETLDINKFDAETQRRIADSIERRKNGDTSNLVEIGSIDELNKLFHAV